MRVLIAHRSSNSRAALADAVPRDGQTPPEIIESADGHEVLDLLLGEDPPALAVIDWDLPAVDGPELCRLVRDFHLSRPPYIVVLAGTSHADTYDALGAGADDCVRTPASAAAIRERLAAGVLAARERLADDDAPSVRATLEAICASDDDSVDFFRFPGAEERLGLGGRLDGEPEGPMVGPSGAAMLEAMIFQQ
jgi:DNA-binding response OmpR family regulator